MAEPSIAAIVALVAADLTAPVVATLAIRPSTPLAGHPEIPRPPPVSEEHVFGPTWPT